METTPPFMFDESKALEVILYIAERLPSATRLSISKILYQADKLSLENYGRFICGDHYIAMEYGPVPSGTLDIMRHRSLVADEEEFQTAGYHVVATRPANCDLLSESDIESLDTAIRKYGRCSPGRLIELCHDKAWEATSENGIIAVEDIARTLPDAELIIEHLHE